MEKSVDKQLRKNESRKGDNTQVYKPPTGAKCSPECKGNHKECHIKECK